MAVIAQVPEVAFVANGATRVFPYGFMIPTVDDLVVSLDGVTQDDGFSVSGLGFGAGNITFTSAPADDVAVAIQRRTALVRRTDYQQSGDFLSTVVNPDFDRPILALQELQLVTDRAVLVASGESGVVLPVAVPNRLLGTDDFGSLTYLPYPPGTGGGDSTQLGLDLLSAAAGKGGTLMVTTQPSGLVRTQRAKNNDQVSSNDYSNLAAAVSAMPAGGTIVIPSGASTAVPASFGNIALDYLGPNVPHAMYDETTLVSRAARLIRVRDGGAHPAIEHAAFAIESQPVGSGDPAVNATDFGLNLSICKKAWPTTSVIGQVVALNIGTRGGYHGADATPGCGDMGNIIINSVQSAFNQSVSALEAVTYYAPNGSFIPGTLGISVQLGIIKASEMLATGLALSAQIGALGNAIEIGNSRGNPAGDGTWTRPFRYVWDNGVDAAYEAMVIAQDGSIVLRAPGSVPTPRKVLRVGSGGGLEIVNNVGDKIVIFNDNGSLSLPVGASLVVNNQQVLAGRIAGWGTPSGTLNRAALDPTAATLAQTVQTLNALILDCRAHGFIAT